MLRVLPFGGTLPWTYDQTEFAKEIDPEGRTTEFVRGPDPIAAGVVTRIMRCRRQTLQEVGWACKDSSSGGRKIGRFHLLP